MGALSENAPFDNKDVDDIRRYKVSIKVVVHSHTTDFEAFDISDDVFSCQLSKSIKAEGKANLALTASKNFMNLIRPGDVINVYFDIKDGEGWIRTFFGFVDRVEEDYAVDEEGGPGTAYHIIASDWQKAVEKTHVYFNPHLVRRRDVGGEDYSTFNIGGLSMISRGLQISGSPSDCVTSALVLQLGFGSQWILPRAHPVNEDDRLTAIRNSVAKTKLLADLRGALNPEQQNSLESLLDNLQPSNGVDDLDSAISREQIQEALRSQLGEIDAGDEQLLVRVRTNLVEYARRTEPTELKSLLDIVNLSDFVEREAIDGYAVEMGMWQQQGPLISIVRSVSNEVINELMFDLRPMSLGGVPFEGTEWDRDPDDIFGNVASDGVPTNGVRYMPSVVMREYPYGTIQSIDGTSIKGDGEGAEALNYIPVGAIFSNKPNVPGRHIVEVPNMNVADNRDAVGPSKGYKIMDVAVLSEKEIRATRLGRSDEDVFNLFGMTSDVYLGSDAQYFMRDFIPVITPIHIARFGLRVREVRTRFARFYIGTGTVTTSPNETQAIGEGTFSMEVGSPVGRGTGIEAVSNFLTSEYRYRNANSGEFWHFHNGVDIGPLARTGSRTSDEYIPPGPTSGETIPIYAIADGYVVCAAPSGAIDGYGNCVGVHHPQFSEGDRKLISFYAHLSSIESKWEATNTSTLRSGQYVAEGVSPYANPAYSPVYVRKGEILGYMGKTYGSRAKPRREFSAPLPHLHFEITSRIPSKYNPDVYYAEANRAAAAAAATTPAKRRLVADSVSPRDVRPPDPGSIYSQDPEAWFAEYADKPLRVLIKEASRAGTTPPEVTEVDFEEGGGEGPHEDEDLARSANTEEVEPDEIDEFEAATAPTPLRPVTVMDQRKQLGRWCLLQDHWFQHNVEYLNGSIVTRPAPEIRVGYRLDILERNLSFYVENVNHTYQYPDTMTTSLTVTRGQPNNPFPAYALPATPGFPGAENSRKEGSRLAQYFNVPDPVAVRNGITFRDRRDANTMATLDGRGITNELDNPANWGEAPYDFSELEADYEPGGESPGLTPADTQGTPDYGAGSTERTANLLAQIDAELGLVNAGEGEVVITGTEVDVLSELPDE